MTTMEMKEHDRSDKQVLVAQMKNVAKRTHKDDKDVKH